jgi:hypothetical protein
MPKRKILIEKWSWVSVDTEDLVLTGKYTNDGMKPFAVTPGMKRASALAQPSMCNLIWFRKPILGTKEIDMSEEDAVAYDKMLEQKKVKALRIDYVELVE